MRPSLTASSKASAGLRSSPLPPGQEEIDDPAAGVAQGVKLEAKEPPLLRVAKRGSFIPQPADPSMTQGVAKLNRLGVDQVERSFAPKQCGAGNQQFADQPIQLVEPDDPALISGQRGKSRAIVLADFLVRLFQTLNAKTALAQSDGQRFRVAESWLMVVRLAPWRERGVLFEIVIHEHIDFGELIV